MYMFMHAYSQCPLPPPLRRPTHTASLTAHRQLDRMPLLTGWPEAARARFAAAAQPARYTAGEVIFRRGDPCESGMLLVLDGLVRLHLTEPGGRELSLALA